MVVAFFPVSFVGLGPGFRSDQAISIIYKFNRSTIVDGESNAGSFAHYFLQASTTILLDIVVGGVSRGDETETGQANDFPVYSGSFYRVTSSADFTAANRYDFFRFVRHSEISLHLSPGSFPEAFSLVP